MIMYYAGSATINNTPEEILIKEKPIGVMLTYFDVYTKNSVSLRRIEIFKKRKVRKN